MAEEAVTITRGGEGGDLDGEEEDEHEAEPECGHGEGDHRHEPDEVVKGPVAAQRRRQRQRQGDDHRDDGGVERQQQRRTEPRPEQRADRGVLQGRVAEVEPEGVHQERASTAPAAPCRAPSSGAARRRHLRGSRAEDRPRRVARHELHEQEGDERDADQRNERLPDPADEVKPTAVLSRCRQSPGRAEAADAVRAPLAALGVHPDLFESPGLVEQRPQPLHTVVHQHRFGPKPKGMIGGSE